MRITILEMARAWFQGDAGPGGNELFLDAKPGTDDPTKFRQGNHTPGLIFGVQSGDFLQDRGPNDPPRRLEKVLVTTGPNDAETVRHWIAEGKPGGRWKIAVQRAGTEDDANMIPVLDCTEGYVEVFGRKVALRGANGDFTWLMGGAGAVVSFLRSPNAAYELELQDDGNFVIYHEAAGHTPIFDSFSTLGRLADLEARLAAMEGYK